MLVPEQPNSPSISYRPRAPAGRSPMVCRAGTNYSGDDVVNFRGQNWNGDVPFAPAKLARPRDLKSLVELIAKATEDNQPLHVVGSSWSFEDCATTDGVMVSLNWLA